MAINRVRIGALVVIALSLSFAAWLTWDRGQRRAISDTIIGPWDALGGEPWLLPNLDDARVAQPDRPHSFREVHAWRQGEGAPVREAGGRSGEGRSARGLAHPPALGVCYGVKLRVRAMTCRRACVVERLPPDTSQG